MNGGDDFDFRRAAEVLASCRKQMVAEGARIVRHYDRNGILVSTPEEVGAVRSLALRFAASTCGGLATGFLATKYLTRLSGIPRSPLVRSVVVALGSSFAGALLGTYALNSGMPRVLEQRGEVGDAICTLVAPLEQCMRDPSCRRVALRTPEMQWHIMCQRRRQRHGDEVGMSGGPPSGSWEAAWQGDFDPEDVDGGASWPPPPPPDDDATWK